MFDNDIIDELAREAGMIYGVEARNEVLGQWLEAPEECGHHCDYDCPRCGQEDT